jgi:poly(3-hydroxybutyrate) depolymerase
MLAFQWQILTQSDTKPTVTNESGYSIYRWKNAQNKALIELITIKDFGHGIAVNPDIKHVRCAGLTSVIYQCLMAILLAAVVVIYRAFVLLSVNC